MNPVVAKLRMISDVYSVIDSHFVDDAHVIEYQPGNWQGVDVKKVLGSKMFELHDVHIFFTEVGQIREAWIEALKPNLPWADDHFEERVCGAPINPGEQWKHWPWGNSASKFVDDFGYFNHNYMERYWPKYAGRLTHPTVDAEGWHQSMHEAIQDMFYPEARFGIRNYYGDLSDIPKQLVSDPYTRQAYLPIFFPEDVGHVDGGRRPCSLGYQFTMRKGRLHCFYPMRSCDYSRHFADDVYLTLLLMEWVLEECRKADAKWEQVKMGSLSMHMTSLHMFENDYRQRFQS